MLLSDFSGLFNEFRGLSLKDWVTLLPLLLALFAFIWKKLLLSWWKGIKAWFQAPSIFCALRDSIDSLVINIIRLEKEVALNNGRTRAIVAKLEQPMWEADGEGQCLTCNSAFLDLVGRESSELTGENWKIIIDGVDSEHVIREWDAALEDKRTFLSTFHIVNKKGTKIKVRAESQLIKHYDGSVLGMLVTLTLLK